MRRAIADAEVGDDLFGDDPTVRELEAATAQLLGKEDAVYVPSGTMANQIAVRLHARPGEAVVTDPLAHVVTVEAASLAGLSGVTTIPVAHERGVYDADAVRAAFAPAHRFFPRTVGPPPAVVWAENTHNNGGGAVWPADRLAEIPAVAAERGLPSHLDGARLWHAALAVGTAESQLAAGFDTVSVCFSKALGAPVGSALAGPEQLVARARRYKQQLGGGFRQAGIIAAGALYALREHRPLLRRTHEMAARFAEQIATMPGIEIDPAHVATNIVRFELTDGDSGAFCERLHAAGVHMLPSGPRAVRAVFYLDIADEDVEPAAEAVRRVVTSAAAGSDPAG